MIESEYKCIIDYNAFLNISEKLSFQYEVKRIVQVNYYYDTNDFQLHKNDITYRIRQKDRNLSIEIKYPIKKDALLRVKKEVVKKVDKVPYSIEMKNSELLCDTLNDETNFIQLIGSLVTERLSYHIKKGIKVDLDKSYYYGVTDYEMEIEFDNEFKDEAYKLLKDLTNNGYYVPKGSKRERFFVQMKGMSQLCYTNI